MTATSAGTLVEIYEEYLDAFNSQDLDESPHS